MKKPTECTTIEEIRAEIDRIDAEVIRLLGKRFGFVKEVVKYKNKDKDSIIAQKRYDSVVKSRRTWAVENGLNPDLIENIYKQLMNYFIGEELKIAEKEE
jgi:isochorismate pyruvate lyase